MTEEGRIDPAVAERVRSDSYRTMAWGIGLVGVGIVLTLGSYFNAGTAEGGGTYYLVWGPVVFGLWRIIKAAMALSQLNQGTVPAGSAPAATPAQHGAHQPDSQQHQSWPPAWPQPPSDAAATPQPPSGAPATPGRPARPAAPARRKGSVI